MKHWVDRNSSTGETHLLARSSLAVMNALLIKTVVLLKPLRGDTMVTLDALKSSISPPCFIRRLVTIMNKHEGVIGGGFVAK